MKLMRVACEVLYSALSNCIRDFRIIAGIPRTNAGGTSHPDKGLSVNSDVLTIFSSERSLHRRYRQYSESLCRMPDDLVESLFFYAIPRHDRQPKLQCQQVIRQYLGSGRRS